MVSDQIRVHRELHRIQATAMGTLMRQALMADPVLPLSQAIPLPRTMNMVIKSFDEELNSLALDGGDDQRT